MRADSPSQTAMAAAFLRALHPVADDPPWVFDDPLAAAFLPDYQQRFLDRLRALPRPWMRAFRQRRSALARMRAQILVRSRFTEDALHAAPQASRYLILAAGLDTYAWRHPETDLPVLEVDHPATQRWKLARLEHSARPAAPRLTFQPIDFERQTLDAVLPAAAEPQFISWLGTSYYLSGEAMNSTLRTLAEGSAPGSYLALDFWRESPAGWDTALLWSTRVATAMQLEPMRTFLEPPALEAMAAAAGWKVAEMLDADAQNHRYLHQRSDELAVPGFAYLALLTRP